MKRILICAAAAIVALASCSKTQVVYNDAPEEIGFKQINSVMTKATDLTGTMGVIAHQGSTPYFPNTEFTFDTDKWKGNPARYWPTTGTLDFTVYAPYNASASYTANVLTLPAVTAADALYYGDERYVNTTKAEKVPVLMKHAAAKIEVQVKGADIYTVTDLSVVNARTSGTLNVTYSDVADYAATSCLTAADPAPTTGNVAILTSGSVAVDGTYKTAGTPGYVLPGPQTKLSITYKDKAATVTTKEITLSDTWVAGKKYIYGITITGDEIFFTATVDDWSDYDGNPIPYGNANMVDPS